MDAKVLEDDLKVKKWFRTINSEGSKKTYLQTMQKYTDFCKMTPTDLFNEALEDVEASGSIARWRFPDRIDEFREFLRVGGDYEVHEYNQDENNLSEPKRKRQKPLAPTSVEGHIGGVRSFYVRNRIQVPKDLNNTNASTIKKNMQVHKKKELKQILKQLGTNNKNTTRDTTLTLCGTSSGLAIAELVKLRIHHILDVDSNNITTLDFTSEDSRVKTGIEFHTFFSPEATEWIWNYIQERGISKDYVGNIPNPERFMKYKEKGNLKGAVRDRWSAKHNIKCDDDFLFCNGDIDDIYLFGGTFKQGKVEEIYEEGYNGTFNEKLESRFRQMTKHGAMGIFRRIAERLEIESEDGHFNKFRSHNLRKFFITTLEDANISSRNIDYMAGKKISKDKRTYIQNRNVEKLKGTYMAVCPELALLTKTVHLTMDESINKIKMENDIENLKLRMEIELNPILHEIETKENSLGSADTTKGEKTLICKFLRGNKSHMQLIKKEHEAKIAELQKEYDELYGHLS